MLLATMYPPVTPHITCFSLQAFLNVCCVLPSDSDLQEGRGQISSVFLILPASSGTPMLHSSSLMERVKLNGVQIMTSSLEKKKKHPTKRNHHNGDLLISTNHVPGICMPGGHTVPPTSRKIRGLMLT